MNITHKRGVVDFNLSSFHFDIKRRLILGGYKLLLYTDNKRKPYVFVCDTKEHAEQFVDDFIQQLTGYGRNTNITEIQTKHHVMLIGA